MAFANAEFKDIGQKRGMEIWRIKTKNPGEWNVHFWLGNETTQDERGSAAIITVQIDDSLNGLPVQGHESSLFLSYFKDGIRYLKGGVASGFTHVIDKYENWKPKLFQCKGKRNVRCTEVECKGESLNLGDVFILDCGLKIFVWMPPESGRLEKIKGMDQARNIRDQRVGKPKIIILDSDWDKNDEFWKILGGKEKIKPAEAGGQDENYWQTTNNQLTLWRVSDDSGEVSMHMLSKGNFQYSQLESKDAFILDTYNAGVYVWIGKNCSSNERKKAMQYAIKYIELQGRSKNTQVVRILEGAEPAEFTQWASSWESAKKRPVFIPKLYQCGDQSGRLTMEEICDYTQKDLDGDDVMILDAMETIYVWIGTGANEEEKKFANQVANRYLQGDTLPRPKGVKIVKMLQGKETPEFKQIFNKWDDYIADGRTVEVIKKKL